VTSIASFNPSPLQLPFLVSPLTPLSYFLCVVEDESSFIKRPEDIAGATKSLWQLSVKKKIMYKHPYFVYKCDININEYISDELQQLYE
jgi:hypothetical protein